MFDTIVESVLAEISAMDAYDKFYNNLSKENFQKLVGFYGKFDNLMKAILKSVMEDGGNFSPAFDFVKRYKEAPNEVRIEFNKKFKNGEYEDLLDMKQGLDDIQENGVDTLKSMQNGGYIELYNDEEYLLTCTITYEANHHYYGNSQWCTASDRLGRYDGWKYFLRYVFNEDDIEDYYPDLDNLIPQIYTVLIQFIDKQKDKKYQAQVYSNCEFGQVCDFKDDSVYNFKDILPAKCMAIIKSEINGLINKQREAITKELNYQTKKDSYIEEKRKIVNQRANRLFDEYYNKIQEEADKKAEFISQKNEILISSSLLSDTNFIKTLITGSNEIKLLISENDNEISEEKIVKAENILKSQYYILINEIKELNDSMVFLSLTPAFGQVSDVFWGNNGFPYIRYSFIDGDYFSGNELEDEICVIAYFNKSILHNGIVNNDVKQIIFTDKVRNGYYYVCYNFTDLKQFFLSPENSELSKYCVIKNNNRLILMNKETFRMNELKCGKVLNDAGIIGNSILLGFNGMYSDSIIEINKETLEQKNSYLYMIPDCTAFSNNTKNTCYKLLFNEKTNELCVLTTVLTNLNIKIDKNDFEKAYLRLYKNKYLIFLEIGGYDVFDTEKNVLVARKCKHISTDINDRIFVINDNNEKVYLD